MRAEQLRNHSCDEKDCPGARRFHQLNSSAAGTTSCVLPTSTSNSNVAGLCRHCDVMQGLSASGPGPGSTVTRGGSYTVTPGGGNDADDTLEDRERQRQASSCTSFAGQLLSRLYLGALPIPLSNYCRL